MSKLFNFISDQINQLMLLLLVNESGDLDVSKVAGGWFTYNTIISAVSIFVYLTVVAVFGIWLWNQGLSTVFSIVKPIGPGSFSPRKNMFQQLFITLFALVMFF
jgi:hypothetical protein